MDIYFLILGEILFVGSVAAAIMLGGDPTAFLDSISVIFILLGTLGLTLMSFSFQEIASALSHVFNSNGTRHDLMRSAYFWEAVIRNFLIVGVIGAVNGLVIMLTDLSDPEVIGPAMATSLLVFLYGAFFSAIFPLPAMFTLNKRIADENRTGNNH